MPKKIDNLSSTSSKAHLSHLPFTCLLLDSSRPAKLSSEFPNFSKMASMNAVIQQILLVCFFLPVTVIDSKNSCPSSSRGDITNPTIMYPFKLENEPPQKTCYDYIDLRCYQGQLVINLPSSGDFYVTDIDYYSKKIALSDPGNCLPQRVMTKFSVYPLEVLYYQNYTYYTCPRSVVSKHGMNEIHCLSNSTSATIAVTGFMEQDLGCQPIVSSLVPVMTINDYDYSEIIADLWLTWNASACKGCDPYGDDKVIHQAISGPNSLVHPSSFPLLLCWGHSLEQHAFCDCTNS